MNRPNTTQPPRDPPTPPHNSRKAPRIRNIYTSLPLLLHILTTQTEATSSIPRSTNSRSIAPPKHPSSPNEEPSQHASLPPWNPSPQIDADGFLRESYSRVEGEWELEANIGGRHRGLEEAVRIRQVPGDGNCLFHSITVAMAATVNSTHIDMAGTEGRRRRGHPMPSSDGSEEYDSEYDSLDPYRCDSDQFQFHENGENDENDDDASFDLRHLHYHSTLLRQKAVSMLSLNPRRLLFLQGNEYLRARDLVDAAAAQYDLNGDEYCDLMRKDSYWGGGPEIVALCNVLRRPIHVYELTGPSHPPRLPSDDEGDSHQDGLVTLLDNNNDNNPNTQPHTFRLRRMACFGSPKFDRRQPLHILSADSRFPDVSPGDQLPSGNHFLALLPEHCLQSIEELRKKKMDRGLRRRTRRRSAGVRGGYSSGLVGEYRHDAFEGGRGRRRRRRSVDGGQGEGEGEDVVERWDTDGKCRKDSRKKNSLWGAVTRCVRPMGQDADGPLRSIIQFAIRLFLRV